MNDLMIKQIQIRILLVYFLNKFKTYLEAKDNSDYLLIQQIKYACGIISQQITILAPEFVEDNYIEDYVFKNNYSLKDLQESLKDLDKDFNLIMGQKYQIFNHEQHCVLKGIITYYSHFYEDK